MNNKRVAAMADNVAMGVMSRVGAEEGVDDEPMSLVDQAIDMMIAASKVIEDNLDKIKADNVPQQAGLDSFRDAFENGVMPYLADMVKAVGVFGGE